MLEEIIKAKAQERMLSGKRSDDTDPVNHGAEGQGRSRDIVGSKIGMSGMQYDRAKYIAENASSEVIEELDKGERTIRGTYDELKSKEKAAKSSSADVKEDVYESLVKNEDELPDDSQSNVSTNAAPKPAKSNDKPKSSTSKSSKASASKSPLETEINSVLSKKNIEAIKRNEEFAAMSDAEKVEELQCRLNEALKRAAIAESELSRLKDVHHNLAYHSDSNIKNLQARLDMAEARVAELEALHGSDSAGE